MSDNDIVKALERCVDERKGCGGCPYSELPHKCAGFHHDILGFVNRQTAEIERLNTEVEKQYEQAQADVLGNMPDGGMSCHWCIEQHKAEAIEEFVEKLKDRVDDPKTFGGWSVDILMDRIDKLLKEMTEDEHD